MQVLTLSTGNDNVPVHIFHLLTIWCT